ncbi:MAG: HlyD family efflux transporter periplasmic adaptor subunit [Bryobacteraceae bacterium]|nr:HlyD family efflux transporter periplasmic adaptor subunit [Bryobacteraceae bacterium]
MKKLIVRLMILAVVAAAGYGAWRLFQGLPGRQQQTPTTKARQGDVVVRSYARGELRAVRSASLTAPNLFGTVQVTRLAPLGAFAREKDLIVEFDDSEVLARLEQKQLELEQVDEQIKKAQADLNIRNNQDQVELLRARYSVRRAELEVKRNELLSAIDQQKNTLNLEEARRRLKQLESDVKSRQEQAQAELAVLRERRNRNVLDIRREQTRLAQVKLLSPISGLVAIKQNRSGFSGMFGSAVPDIREGDQVQPGIPVAEVLDLSELEVVARVGELDRANLTEGQEVLIRLDAIADKVFNGKIKSMSGTASANVFSADPGKKFDVVFSIDMKQLLTTLGATPEQVARILATAEANRKKPAAATGPAMFGGMPAGAMGMAMGGGNGGGARTFMMGGGGPGAAGGGMPQMSAEQQTQMREAFQKALGGRNMQDLSQEERQKIFAQLRATAGGGAATKGGATKGGEATKAAATKGGQPAGAEGAQAEGGERGQRGQRGQRGERGQRGGGGDQPLELTQMRVSNTQGYSQEDMASAKLPTPPAAESDLEVLLRPGLLADVEIIVEKVPDAIFVPNQAVFEKEGKPVVFVKTQKGFEQRVIKIAKRSETVTVIGEGVQAGDVIAMADPTASPSDRKKAGEPKSSGGPMGAMPGGASKGGQ